MRPFTLFFPCLALAGAACQRVPDRVANTPATSAATITTPDAALRETRWVLRQLNGRPVALPASNVPAPYLRITAAGTAEGQGGCNRFRGGLKPVEDDGQLQFAPLLSARMACPTLAVEQQFTQALDATRTYRITGDTLRLYASAERTGTPLARLEAVYLR